jgi:hypothetical protein
VFCSLRWGELAALPRYCVDTDAGIISVRVSVVELARGPLVTGPTKSAAGNRDVTIPPFLLPDVIAHLEDFTAPAPRALVFTGPQGAQLRRSNFTRQCDKLIADEISKRAQAALKPSGTQWARGKKKHS